jgi:hypothetical protein
MGLTFQFSRCMWRLYANGGDNEAFGRNDNAGDAEATGGNSENELCGCSVTFNDCDGKLESVELGEGVFRILAVTLLASLGVNVFDAVLLAVKLFVGILEFDAAVLSIEEDVVVTLAEFDCKAN